MAATVGFLILCLLGSWDKVIDTFKKARSICRRFWTWISPHLGLLGNNFLSPLTRAATTIGDVCDRAHHQLTSFLDLARKLFRDCQTASLPDLCSPAWWSQRSRHLAQGYRRSQSWIQRVQRQSLPQPLVTPDIVSLDDITIRQDRS